MSIQITVTLEEELLARLKQESEVKGQSLDKTIEGLLRSGLTTPAGRQRANITPFHSGPPNPAVNLDCSAELLEQIEGPLRL
ncbi:MAG TPA: hypothetical protein VKX45_18210 [Bryobacteraceae bacterium]|jgi:hypothetical protein|nr:hypothetical protein [Bryobacteraceae bacterium]